MDKLKEQIEQYLPEIETFLTSVLLEETSVKIVSSDEVEGESLAGALTKTDVFLYTRDQENQSDVIIILDEVWFGLLSSIMLGVEEKTNNEITRDLLKKFSTELTSTLVPKIEENEGSVQIDTAEIQVLTSFQLEKVLEHEKYVWTRFEVEGLADENVRAGLLIGDPEALIIAEEPEQEVEQDEESRSEEGGFSEVNADEMEEMGTREEVISGRYIEFDDFDSEPQGQSTGIPNSMELLKDVEMDVSVELGRIELPLGKVLQLAKGAVIELEKLAGEPVDILVNGQCIAHGEVVVIDEHFGVRISNLITTKQRLAGLN